MVKRLESSYPRAAVQGRRDGAPRASPRPCALAAAEEADMSCALGADGRATPDIAASSWRSASGATAEGRELLLADERLRSIRR